MNTESQNPVVDRGIALHKMIRLVTAATAGDGYLTFMGNEFGHPEWIDFPRPGNGNSFHYCRRQWSLLNNDKLKYQDLYAFDKDMIRAATEYHILDQEYPYLKWIHNSDHVIAFERGGLLFAFNFSPTESYVDYGIPVGTDKPYDVLFSSDDFCYNGYGRIAHMRMPNEGGHLSLYLPARTAIVLAPAKD
jgi:1,4-alpha-glucan branching enzyme